MIKTLQESLDKAKDGSAFDQAALAGRYYFGTGVPASTAKAEEWFTKAGKQGDRFAQFQVVKMRIENSPDKNLLFDAIDISGLFNKLIEV